MAEEKGFEDLSDVIQTKNLAEKKNVKKNVTEVLKGIQVFSTNSNFAHHPYAEYFYSLEW